LTFHINPSLRATVFCLKALSESGQCQQEVTMKDPRNTGRVILFLPRDKLPKTSSECKVVINHNTLIVQTHIQRLLYMFIHAYLVTGHLPISATVCTLTLTQPTHWSFNSSSSITPNKSSTTLSTFRISSANCPVTSVYAYNIS
jgi:hypothetical protein